MIRTLSISLAFLCLALPLAGHPAQGTAKAKKERTLTLGAYTTPREAYGKAVIPAFQRHWKEKTGEDVRLEESYLGSGAQARAIIGGFEADVAALSLAPDIEAIAKSKLITHDWRKVGHGGIASTSIAVIAVRKGNPKGIEDWDDLRKKGLEVLTPNPRTSGGAMWNIAALYGAALRGHTSAPKDDSAAAEKLIAEVLANVSIMDKGARESMLTFEKGVGDAAITYENEVLVGRQGGQDYEYVVPRSTILIENPIAVIDGYADEHGNRDLAGAFVEFVATEEMQRAFSKYGLRPVDPKVAAEVDAKLPAPEDLFTIRDLGDWPKVQETLFSERGAFARIAATLGK